MRLSLLLCLNVLSCFSLHQPVSKSSFLQGFHFGDPLGHEGDGLQDESEVDHGITQFDGEEGTLWHKIMEGGAFFQWFLDKMQHIPVLNKETGEIFNVPNELSLEMQTVKKLIDARNRAREKKKTRVGKREYQQNELLKKLLEHHAVQDYKPLMKSEGGPEGEEHTLGSGSSFLARRASKSKKSQAKSLTKTPFTVESPPKGTSFDAAEAEMLKYKEETTPEGAVLDYGDENFQANKDLAAKVFGSISVPSPRPLGEVGFASDPTVEESSNPADALDSSNPVDTIPLGAYPINIPGTGADTLRSIDQSLL